jgi:hypothetical protein
MKWLVVTVIGATLMAHGQEAKPHGDAHKRNTSTESKKATDATSQTVIVVNQQQPNGEQNSHPAKLPSYLSRLFSPENLPNIALVIIGFGGIVVAIKSLRRIDIQITEMRRQVDVTLLQLRAMNEEITEMSQQTASLKEYVDETKKIAKSTVDSAKAAQDNIALLINKERARIRIEPGELTIQTVDGHFWVGMVDVTVSNVGAMKAFPSDTQAALFLGKSKESMTASISGSLLGDSVFPPDKTVEENVYCIVDVGPETIKALNDEAAFMHLYGIVHYTDVFGGYVTPFRYIWTATARYAIATELGVPGSEKIDITNTLYGEWRRHGPEGDNAAT